MERENKFKMVLPKNKQSKCENNLLLKSGAKKVEIQKIQKSMNYKTAVFTEKETIKKLRVKQ